VTGPADRAALFGGLVAGAVAVLLWGSWSVMSRLAVTGSLGVWELCLLRYAAMVAVLLPWLLRRGAVTRAGIAGVGWRGVLALGLTGGLPFPLCVLYGLALAPAARHAVFGSAIVPLATLAFGILLLGDRPGRRQLAGTLVICLGVGLTMRDALDAAAVPLGPGDALFFVSALLWAGYTVATRVHRVPALPAVIVIGVTGLAGTLAALPFVAPLDFSAASAAEIVFHTLHQGVGAALVGTLLFLRASERLGPSRAALFVAVIPPVTTLLAWPVLGEAPGPASLVGVVLVSIGMAIALAGGAARGSAR